MRLLRVVGIVSGLIVGFGLWDLSLNFLDDKARSNDLVIFYIPIVIFALPLAVLALNRQYVVAGIWVLAVAQVLGFLKFVIDVFATPREAGALNRASMSELLTVAAIWLLFLGATLVAIRGLRGSAGTSPRN